MTRIISIEGNIGSGKSTLVKKLKSALPEDTYYFVDEPVDIWQSIQDTSGVNIINKFYSDQARYAFSFQMMAYISRVSMLKQAIRENPGKIIVTERCVDTDREVFAKMLYDDGLIEEIKTEFRENAGATDAGDVQKKIALARDGLDRMRAFTGLDQGSSKWDVSLKGPFDGT